MSENDTAIQRDCCLFYKSYIEAGEKLKNPEKELQFYKDIFIYGTTQKLPDYENDPLLDMAWTFIKPLLDANIRNYLNGSKGGAPKGNKNAQGNRKTTENNHKQPVVEKKQGKVTVTDTDKVTVTVTDTDTVNTSLSAATPEVQPPKGKVIILDEDDDESTYTRDVELLKRQWQEQQQRELARNEN